MAQLTLSFLGHFQVTLAGKPITNFESDRVRVLLAYLATEADRPHRREQVASLLWPDQPEQTARSNLRHVLRKLHQALGKSDPDSPWLLTTRQTIQFNPTSNHKLDVTLFTSLLAICESHAHASLFECQDCIERLSRAAALYGGNFLAGLSLAGSEGLEEWVLVRQERFHRQALETMYQLANYYEAADDYEAAQQFAWRQVELEMWREEAHQQLMRILARSGQRSAALAQYESCCQILAEELGLDPSAETVALHERIRSGQIGEGRMKEQANGRVVGQPPPHPSPASSLQPWQHPPLPDCHIRRPELEQTILNKLQAQQILILVGLGGAGKSTLATWLAHEVAGSWVEGVIWVDDCQLDQGGFDIFEAQSRIARTFQVELQGHSLAERAGELRSLLRDKSYLLVLDDVWDSQDLEHLRVHNHHSFLLITTRNATVIHAFGTLSPIQVNGFSPTEGRDLFKIELEEWVDSANLDELLARVGHLPLALVLVRALIQDGYTLSELLAHFRGELPDLSILDIDDHQTRSKSLTSCFDLSFNHVPSTEMQQRFVQLGYFNGTFQMEAVAAVWGIPPKEARRSLLQLVRLALVIREGRHYRLHPLLRDYARQKLMTTWPDLAHITCRRHAAFYIRQVLYHPQVLKGVTDPAPNLDEAWADIVAGVKWAARQVPDLVTCAALLAHTERPALLAALGPALVEAIRVDLSTVTDRSRQALLYELLGDLYLLRRDLEPALACFEEAGDLWLAVENGLACGRVKLRQAGIYLLQQAPSQAAEVARQAQICLARSLPLTAAELTAAQQLFYWFNMVYIALVRWEPLPQGDVAGLAELAGQTGDELLKAKGLHIYRLWCTETEVDRPAEVQDLGRELSGQVVSLLHAAGETEMADREAMWTEYRLTGRCSPEAATRFAQRISRKTPQMSQSQIQLIENEGIRWWLQTDEAERLAWLSRMLPRYLEASDSREPPLEPESQAWQRVRDIIGLSGTLWKTSRRFTLEDYLPPAQHFLNIPEWRVFSGQKILPIVDQSGEQFIKDCLAALETTLASSELYSARS